MYASFAIRSKLGPLIPGAAALAAGAPNSTAAIVSVRTRCIFQILLFMFIGLIAALLIGDVDFGHQSAEVLRVVRQVIKIGRVEIENAAARIQRCIAGIENDVQRLAAAKRD